MNNKLDNKLDTYRNGLRNHQVEIYKKTQGGEPCTRSRRGRSGSPQSPRPSAAGLIGTPRTRCFGLPSAKGEDCEKHHERLCGKGTRHRQ
jgi:hypothetical protein